MLLEVLPARQLLTHSWSGTDRGVLVPFLPITVAGWRVVPGALRLMHLKSSKEMVLPAASTPVWVCES